MTSCITSAPITPTEQNYTREYGFLMRLLQQSDLKFKNVKTCRSDMPAGPSFVYGHNLTQKCVTVEENIIWFYGTSNIQNAYTMLITEKKAF